MNQFKDQSEMKMAMNGRMGLLTGGIILIFTALSTTMTYGINLWGLAAGAARGEAEYTEVLESANMSVGILRVIAVCFLVMAVIEISSGFLSARFSNRLDKAKNTKKLIILLLALELVMQVFLLLTGMLNLGLLITSLVIPLYMLWSASKLCKVAKEYPDRTYALNTKKMKEQQRSSAPAKPAPPKSLRERAMMNAAPEEDSETEDSAESEDTSEPEDASEPMDRPEPEDTSEPTDRPEPEDASESSGAPERPESE